MSLFPAYPSADFHAQQEEIRAAIERVLGGANFILGPEVEAFEREFAAWIGARHAIGVANGTDAIELLLRAHGIGPGDKVGVPSHTAVASISGIERAGAVPVFVDVDPDVFTVTGETLAAALARPDAQGLKAMLAVHLYGHPAPMHALRAICDPAGILLLEDCAQAHGAGLRGQRAGTLAAGASFSFYPTKNLGAIGDGGAITTDDDALAERLRWLRQYGWSERYISTVRGVNSRLDELQAAILRVKLRRLDAGLARRAELAAAYADGLAGLPGIQPPVIAPDCRHAWHLFVIRATQRDDLMRHLQQAGVPVAVHYPAAVHQQPAYAALPPGPAGLPGTESIVPQILSLPLHPFLPDAAIEATCAAIRAFHPDSWISAANPNV